MQTYNCVALFLLCEKDINCLKRRTWGRFSCLTESETGETSDCVTIHEMHKDIYKKMLFKKGGADDKVTSLLHYLDIVESKRIFHFYVEYS